MRILSFAFLIVSSPAALAAQVDVRVDGGPAPLVFPLPEGTPVLLTATVSGLAPREVFLGTEPDGFSCLPLAAAGEGRYTIDLADPGVTEFMRAEASTGLFRVVAVAADGAAESSGPIRFFLRGATPPDPWLSFREGTRSRPVGAANAWADPTRVDLVEVRLGRAEPPASGVTALAGPGDGWLFVFSPGPGTLLLPVTPDIRKAWAEAGTLSILGPAEWSFARKPTREIRAIPTRFDFPGEQAAFTLYQRREAPIPGTRGWLSARIGDVSRGALELSVTTADGGVALPSVTVRAGDAMRVSLANDAVLLSVEKVNDVLLGEDSANLVVRRIAGGTGVSIDRLLETIATSGIRFVREGAEADGATAAAYLRAKWERSPTASPPWRTSSRRSRAALRPPVTPTPPASPTVGRCRWPSGSAPASPSSRGRAPSRSRRKAALPKVPMTESPERTIC